jgi:signal transduction histidine kinase
LAEAGRAGEGRAASEPPRPASIRWPSGLLRVAAAAGLCVLVAFLFFEGLEEALAPDDAAAHALHLVRGLSASLLTALVVGLVTHRNERRRAAQLEAEVTRRTREAEEARSFLQLVVDTTPAALLVLDPDKRVVRANRTAEAVHGLPPVGRTCHELVAGRPDPCPDCGLDAGSGVPPCHTVARTGEVLSVESHPLRLPDGQEGVLLVEQVVTEQRKLQARLLHQEKMAAFGLLAAGVAHEMGNPLSSVEAQLQLLAPEDLPGEARTVLATVRQEVARLGRILRELVDFARRRRDEATLVSVQSVVADALRLLRHDRRMRAVTVQEEFDPETPPVFVIEDHLMQVVLNLLLNALDAMPAGGVLRIEVGTAGAQVALRVHDTGVGMDRAVLARCFEPLFTTKEPGRGTGLGLSISRDITRAAGGEVELHSAPGRGTTAVVTLPAFAAAPAAVAAAASPSSPADLP